MGKNQTRFSLSVLTLLFFLWGFITCLNDILIPYLKSSFQLSYASAALVQGAFFLAYFIMSLPSGRVIERVGYQKGIVLGLLTAGLGALLFFPAASFHSFGLFLGALFVLASGITLLQVAANPYVTLLGAPESASTRLILTQAFNSLGTTLAPLFGGVFLLGSLSVAKAEAVKGPYVAIGFSLLAIALLFSLLKLPKPETSSQEKGSWNELKKYPMLWLGAFAIFVYVGAEVSIGSFLISYIEQPHVLGISAKEAAVYVTYYWGGAMVGRFLGSYLSRNIQAERILAAASLLAVLLLFLAFLCQGRIALVAVLSVGLCNSIMFPTIFAMGVRGLGTLTSLGSSILVMAIVGGAIIPLGVGYAGDRHDLNVAFLIPAVCYAYIFYYGLKGSSIASASGNFVLCDAGGEA